jgi:hypothetical protein
LARAIKALTWRLPAWIGAALLLSSAVIKMLSPQSFRETLGDNLYFDAGPWVVGGAWLIVFVECWVGLHLLLHPRDRIACLAGAVVFALFCAYLTYLLLSPTRRACGCFGSTDPSGRLEWLLAGDFVLTCALTAVGFGYMRAPRRSGPGSPR